MTSLNPHLPALTRRPLRAVPGLLLALAATLITGPAHAQDEPELTVEEVVSRHVEARGGLESWRAVHSLTLTGKYTAFGVTAPFKLQRERPDHLRFEHRQGPHDVVLASDGETSWWINPWMGIDWPAELPVAETRTLLADSYLDNALIDYQAKGNQVVLEGRDRFEGTPTYRLKVTLANGLEETWHLDARTFLEVAVIGTIGDFGTELECQTYFSDFRKAGNLVLPFHTEREYGIRFRVMEVETVEINPQIPPDAFRFPPPPGMDRLASLAGTWKVQVETRDNPDFTWFQTETTATIRADFHGNLLQEEMSYSASLRRHVVRTRGYDRFRGVYRDLVMSDASYYPNLLEGRFEGDRLVETNLTTGTPVVLGDTSVHTRLTTYDLAADSFKVEEEQSTDGGETWRTLTRLSYSQLPAEPSAQQ